MLLTVGGAVIAAAALNIFLLPSGFAPGGISGIAFIINTLTHGIIPVGTGTFVLNIPLLYWAIRYWAENLPGTACWGHCCTPL